MNDALTIGPLLLPFSLLLVVASMAISLAVGQYVGRRSGVDADADGTLAQGLLLGAVIARLAFVLEYKNLYFSAPLTIFDVRDGGWNAVAGLLGIWFFAFHRYRRRPALRKPLQRALLAGTALFALGTGLLATRPGPVRMLPDLHFPSIEGRTVTLAQFRGQPTVVNLWATWCPPCVREMPMFVEAQSRHADVHFVFLNQGEEGAQVARWLHNRRLSLDNVLLDDKRQVSAVFKQQGYPTTLFFDAEGKLVSSRIGELSAATLAQHLERTHR